MVCISAASWGVITAGTPLLAGWGSHILALMVFSRFLMGLSQGEPPLLTQLKHPKPQVLLSSP